jgi:outer membrane biosynthesis protein TonB
MVFKKAGVKKVVKKAGESKYVKVAKELTELMGLDPAIDTSVDEEELQGLLVEAGGMLDANDTISDLATEVLTELGVELPSGEEEEEEKPAKKVVKRAATTKPAKKVPMKKAAKVEEEEEEEEPEEEEEEEETAEGDELDDLDRSGLKKFIAENELDIKVFKSMKDDDIRAAIRAIAEPEEEEKPAKKAPAKKAPMKKAVKKEEESGPTRAEVFKEIMEEGGGTQEEIVESMHANYKDGNSSEAEARFQVGLFLRLLRTMGFVEKNKKDKYVLIG